MKSAVRRRGIVFQIGVANVLPAGTAVKTTDNISGFQGEVIKENNSEVKFKLFTEYCVAVVAIIVAYVIKEEDRKIVN
jgi:hypothetical protein